MPVVLLTGFPGFLGSRLVAYLLERSPGDRRIACLVQPRYRQRAEERAAVIEEEAGAAGRIRLYDGDITQPDLGLGVAYDALQQEVHAVYHLAAVYDLAVARDVGLRVNLRGTRHTLDFASGCTNLQRFHYVSTCYVSGRYDGIFTEGDLKKGQRFNNYYEETKYLAEVAVQDRRRAGLPATIYRPGIVVGDSRTGATQKYDGPYYLIRWMLRWRRIVPMPIIGNPRRYVMNIVPIDFVVNAIGYLSRLERSEGTVYQLADPHGLTADALVRIFAGAADRRLLRMPVPPALAHLAVDHVPALYHWMGILPNAVDYFTHPTRYTVANTRRDLRGSGINCPHVASYARALVDFVRAHPDGPPAEA